LANCHLPQVDHDDWLQTSESTGQVFGQLSNLQ